MTDLLIDEIFKLEIPGNSDMVTRMIMHAYIIIRICTPGTTSAVRILASSPFLKMSGAPPSIALFLGVGDRVLV